MDEDTRTLQQLAQEALNVQDASNLSGVVHSWSRSISRLRTLLEPTPGYGTRMVNHHPINPLWADKVNDLTLGVQTIIDAYTQVTALARGE